MITTVNIGLKDNPLSLGHILSLFYVIIDEPARGFRIEEGEYLGEPEKTLVLSLEIDRFDDFTRKCFSRVCTLMNQDCIAVYPEGYKGELIYRHDWSKEEIEFDMRYFIPF